MYVCVCDLSTIYVYLNPEHFVIIGQASQKTCSAMNVVVLEQPGPVFVKTSLSVRTEKHPILHMHHILYMVTHCVTNHPWPFVKASIPSETNNTVFEKLRISPGKATKASEIVIQGAHRHALVQNRAQVLEQRRSLLIIGRTRAGEREDYFFSSA